MSISTVLLSRTSLRTAGVPLNVAILIFALLPVVMRAGTANGTPKSTSGMTQLTLGSAVIAAWMLDCNLVAHSTTGRAIVVILHFGPQYRLASSLKELTICL